MPFATVYTYREDVHVFPFACLHINKGEGVGVIHYHNGTGPHIGDNIHHVLYMQHPQHSLDLPARYNPDRTSYIQEKCKTGILYMLCMTSEQPPAYY